MEPQQAVEIIRKHGVERVVLEPIIPLLIMTGNLPSLTSLILINRRRSYSLAKRGKALESLAEPVLIHEVAKLFGLYI